MDSGRWGRGRGVSWGMLPLLGLHAVNEYYRLPWKPPVTAGLLAANTLVYLRPSLLDALLPTIDEVWFNPHLILKVILYVLSHNFLIGFSLATNSITLSITTIVLVFF